jgi:mannosyl-oligosaccharide alpha-1,2-mannosidase
MYLMWRTTGETIWRERAWEMYLSMEKYAKLPSGAYATVPNVDTEIHAPADYQQR